MIRTVFKRVTKWFSTRKDDPIPRALTVGGSIVSAAALADGGLRDGSNLLTNIEGNLVLAGPGLVISNIVVKRMQRARAERTIEPLMARTGRFLCEGIRTAQQALRLLGAQTLPEMPNTRLDFATLAARLGSAHSQMVTVMDRANENQTLPPSFSNAHPLSFPNFGLIDAFVQQADRHYVMPETALAAAISREFANTCGFEFTYMQQLGGGSHVRHVGLANIRQESESANPVTTGVFSQNYLKVALDCVYRSSMIAESISREAPSSFLSDVPDDDDPHWLKLTTNINLG